MIRKLTKKQHVFPRFSLGRFSDSHGNIQIFHVASNKYFTGKSNNGIFVVNQEWDQRAEESLGKGIEDKFQNLVEHCLKNEIREIPSDGNELVTQLYALWLYRSIIKNFDDQFVNQKLTPQPLTKEQMNSLELNHTTYVDADGNIPKRMMRGMVLQGGIMSFLRQYRHVKWFLLKSPALELIVPDNPVDTLFIPVSPNWCLVAEHDVAELSFKEALYANTKFASGSKTYYCGRDLSRCFGA